MLVLLDHTTRQRVCEEYHLTWKSCTACKPASYLRDNGSLYEESRLEVVY